MVSRHGKRHQTTNDSPARGWGWGHSTASSRHQPDQARPGSSESHACRMGCLSNGALSIRHLKTGTRQVVTARLGSPQPRRAWRGLPWARSLSTSSRQRIPWGRNGTAARDDFHYDIRADKGAVTNRFLSSPDTCVKPPPKTLPRLPRNATPSHARYYATHAHSMSLEDNGRNLMYYRPQ